MTGWVYQVTDTSISRSCTRSSFPIHAGGIQPYTHLLNTAITTIRRKLNVMASETPLERKADWPDSTFCQRLKMKYRVAISYRKMSGTRKYDISSDIWFCSHVKIIMARWNDNYAELQCALLVHVTRIRNISLFPFVVWYSSLISLSLSLSPFYLSISYSNVSRIRYPEKDLSIRAEHLLWHLNISSCIDLTIFKYLIFDNVGCACVDMWNIVGRTTNRLM